jgi:ankyrin repeat protein
LLEANAYVDIQDNNGETALHNAAWQGQVQIVEILLKANAYVDKQDKRGKTALHYAADNGKYKAMEMLLKVKARVDMQDKDGDTPLDCARRCSYGNKVEILELLTSRQLHGAK